MFHGVALVLHPSSARARRVERARQAAHGLWTTHVPLWCENATLMVGTASHGAVC
jgi:hypothetical protein